MLILVACLSFSNKKMLIWASSCSPKLTFIYTVTNWAVVWMLKAKTVCCTSPVANEQLQKKEKQTRKSFHFWQTETAFIIYRETLAAVTDLIFFIIYLTAYHSSRSRRHHPSPDLSQRAREKHVIITAAISTERRCERRRGAAQRRSPADTRCEWLHLKPSSARDISLTENR